MAGSGSTTRLVCWRRTKSSGPKLPATCLCMQIWPPSRSVSSGVCHRSPPRNRWGWALWMQTSRICPNSWHAGTSLFLIQFYSFEIKLDRPQDFCSLMASFFTPLLIYYGSDVIKSRRQNRCWADLDSSPFSRRCHLLGYLAIWKCFVVLIFGPWLFGNLLNLRREYHFTMTYLPFSVYFWIYLVDRNFVRYSLLERLWFHYHIVSNYVEKNSASLTCQGIWRSASHVGQIGPDSHNLIFSAHLLSCSEHVLCFCHPFWESVLYYYFSSRSYTCLLWCPYLFSSYDLDSLASSQIHSNLCAATLNLNGMMTSIRCGCCHLRN